MMMMIYITSQSQTSQVNAVLISEDYQLRGIHHIISGRAKMNAQMNDIHQQQQGKCKLCHGMMPRGKIEFQ